MDLSYFNAFIPRMMMIYAYIVQNPALPFPKFLKNYILIYYAVFILI